MVVLETMARCLPVIVNRFGRLWSDLAFEGLYGLGYDKNEVVWHIVRLLAYKRLWKIHPSKSVKKAKRLTIDRFIEGHTNFIKNAY